MIIHRIKVPMGTIVTGAINKLLSVDPKHDFMVDDIRFDRVSQDLILDISQREKQEKDKPSV